MNDHYLELTQRPIVRRVIRGLRLPLPLPPRLERASGPWLAQPLREAVVTFGTTPHSGLVTALLRALRTTGAVLDLAPESPVSLPRLAAELDCTLAPSAAPPAALVFDASGLQHPGELGALHAFFQPRLSRLRPNGRIVLLGRPSAPAPEPAAAATAQALEGFCRSLAKEVGRHGVTAQLITVAPGAEDRLEGPLRFLLSPHSAYIDGQVLRVSGQVQSPPATPWVTPLAGKTALVTGAAHGIGAAIAQVLTREGARVVCLDRPGEEAVLANRARQLGATATALALDLADTATPPRLAAALQQSGGLHLIVHNAGITRDRMLSRMSLTEWDAVLDVNLAAVLRLDQALLPGVLREDGRIVCLSSINGIAGHRGQTNYAAAKAGLLGYVAAQSQRLAPRGITVNAVAPGFIETRMTAAMPALARQLARRLNALAQGGVPEDVAEAVAFLLSPGAAGLTGTVLRVCGLNMLGA